MKKIKYPIKCIAIALFFISTSLFSIAQVDSLRLTLDNIFTHVDKSQVPTGFLEEYGAQFVNLKAFNGQLTDSNFIYDIDVWNLIYNDFKNR
ncbi:MAG: hypothetical protein JSS98_12910 [Bacteroidetes bacterium]|nr:hypothetical protein [Bacteroidota bacterium]